MLHYYMRAVDLIADKTRGCEHTDLEISDLVEQYVRASVPDYQMSAWLMAVLWRGLSAQETSALTAAMVASGDVLDLSGLPGTPLDKHSTGGVGDKTSLAVVPIWASAGIPVAKMSGRGLGHTGGTLDKLESIPGLRTSLTNAEIMTQVERVGACICAQSERLVPADRMMYALRDATATVESLPLIAASIMSKKIAGGSRAIVLDVKVGSGAFMKTVGDAHALAQSMIRLGDLHGLRVAAVLSGMDEPLGFAIGNRLEVGEIVSLLRNDPTTDPRLAFIVRYLAAIGFVLAGRVTSLAAGQQLAADQIASGAALDKLTELVEAQGGNAAFLHSMNVSAEADGFTVKAERSGWVARIDARQIGAAAMRLGAGRATKNETIDPDAGIVLHAASGIAVSAGDVLATLYTRRETELTEGASLVRASIQIDDEQPTGTPLIYETLGFSAD